jgi:1-acyl-sn-glycerol-3-phosphate acyltransferase
VQKLVYDFRFFRWVLYYLAVFILKLGRWKLIGRPPNLKKYVVIAAPHTSNWDFPVFMCLVGRWGLRVRFLGKDTLFSGPLGRLFYSLGGISVNRGSRQAAALIEQGISEFEHSDEMILAIAPEGTRTGGAKWKTGFYRIALGAGVPVALAYLDSGSRELGFGGAFYPTGDLEKDIQAIKEFYADKTGINQR